MKKGKLKSLDGIKGIAIWFIVLYHTLGHFGSTYPGFMVPIKKYGGSFGNSFFFMISGFTICYVYKDIVLDHSLSFKEYMGKRIKKLYPCYLISSLVCVCLFTVIHERNMFTLTEVILNILMLTSGWVNDIWPFNYPCWFVSQLLLCYIIYYFISYFLGRKFIIYGYVFLIGAGYLLCTFPMNFPFCYEHDGIGILNFFMGCILYEFYILYSHRFKKAVSIIGMGFLLLIIWIIFKFGFTSFVDNHEFLFALIVSPVCIINALEIKPLKSILENKVLIAAVGNISMAVFFWHVPLTAIFIAMRNNSLFSLCPANLYYTILLLFIFLFSHIVSRLRKVMMPRWDIFLNNLKLYAHVDNE